MDRASAGRASAQPKGVAKRCLRSRDRAARDRASNLLPAQAPSTQRRARRLDAAREALVKLEQAFSPGRRVAGFRKNGASWFGRVLERIDDADDGLPTFRIQPVGTLPFANHVVVHWDLDLDCRPLIAKWLKTKEDREQGLSLLANRHYARREHLLQSDNRGHTITWAAMCPTKTKNDRPSEMFEILSSAPYDNNN